MGNCLVVYMIILKRGKELEEGHTARLCKADPLNGTNTTVLYSGMQSLR